MELLLKQISTRREYSYENRKAIFSSRRSYSYDRHDKQINLIN